MASILTARRQNQQPQQATKISFGNPLARGVVFISSQHQPYDLVSGSMPVPVGSGFTQGVGGPGVGTVIASGSSAIDYNAATAAANVLGEITCLAVCVLNSAGADLSVVAKCTSNGATNTPFDFGLTTGGPIRLGRANGGYRVWAGVAAATAGKSQVIVATQGADIGVAPQFYIDGVFDTGTPTSLYGGSGSGSAVSNTTPVRMHNRGDLGTPYDGRVFLAAVWNRKLSASEIASISANPWQLFQAPSRRLWAAAGAPASITGTFSSTLADSTLAASGAATHAGSFASTLGNATMAASGSVGSAPAGAIASTLAGFTMAATGTLNDSGAIASTLQGCAMAAAGIVASNIAGTITSTMDSAQMFAGGYVGTPPVITGIALRRRLRPHVYQRGSQ